MPTLTLTRPRPRSHIDTAPSIPFDLAAVGGARRLTVQPVSLAAMTAVAEDAGRAAKSITHSLDDRDIAAESPTIAALLAEHTPAGARAAAILTDLFRACVRGALDPATD